MSDQPGLRLSVILQLPTSYPGGLNYLCLPIQKPRPLDEGGKETRVIIPTPTCPHVGGPYCLEDWGFRGEGFDCCACVHAFERACIYACMRQGKAKSDPVYK